MKIKCILLLTVSISLSLISCGNGKKKSDSTTNKVEFKKIRVDDFEISMPRDMKRTTGLNSDASLQFQNIHDEMYTLVIDESKQEFIDALKDTGYREKSTIVLYRDIQLKRLGERMYITHQSDSKSKVVSGLETETVELDAKVDNIEEELSYFLTFIDGNSKIFMLMSWTLKSKKQEHKKTFETVATSFELVDE